MWSSVTQFPDDLAVFCRGGFPSPSRASFELLTHHARWARRPIFFVGDLDPLDLTIFAALLSGGADLRPSPGTVPIRYLGEREHLVVVKRVLPTLDQLIGPECLALLESGRKLELEGAGHSPPHLCRMQ